MAYEPAALTEFKNGNTPLTGTLVLGSLFEAEFDQLYGNWNHFFGVGGTTLTIDGLESRTGTVVKVLGGVKVTTATSGVGATDGFNVDMDGSNNARLWNYENTDLVIGTNNIDRIHVTTSGSLQIKNTAPVNTGLFTITDDSQIIATMTSYSNDGSVGKPYFQLFKARGTAASPLPVQSGDNLGAIHFRGFCATPGHDGNGFEPCVALGGSAMENFTAGNTGAGFYIQTMHPGTNTLTNDLILVGGNCGIGTNMPSIDARLHVVHTTTQLRLAYDVDSYADITVDSGSGLTIDCAESGTLTFKSAQFRISDGSALIIASADNAEWGFAVHNGTNLIIGTGGTNAGDIVITNTTECTGADTGAFQVDGGAHIAKNLSVSGDLTDGAGVPVAGWLDDGTPYYKKVVNIGDWNMDATGSKNVAHGITNWKQIINIYVVIRNDDDTAYFNLYRFSDGADPALMMGGIGLIGSTNIELIRRVGSIFDSINYDATSYNRGFIIIEYY